MNSVTDKSASRRAFLHKAGILLTSAAVICLPPRQAQAKQRRRATRKAIRFPTGGPDARARVLRRILLIYEDIQGRLNSGKEFPPEVLSSAAGIIQAFIENYHEKLEEDYLFPRFEEAGKLVELVTVLKEQHKAGRV